jgi:predicted phage tail protein
LITCNLYGELALKFGETHQFECRNTKEVIKALDANFDDFAQYLLDAAKQSVVYHIIVDGLTIGSDLNLLDPVIKSIDIAPAIEGSAEVGKFLLGAGLLIASAFMPATFLGLGSGIWGAAGASLLFGAVGEWISPSQKPQTNDTSYRLDGSGNQTYQGSPVPLAIGLDFVWAESPPGTYFLENEKIPVNFDYNT